MVQNDFWLKYSDTKCKKTNKPYDHLLFNQLGHGAFETNSYTTFGKKILC